MYLCAGILFLSSAVFLFLGVKECFSARNEESVEKEFIQNLLDDYVDEDFYKNHSKVIKELHRNFFVIHYATNKISDVLRKKIY